MSLGRYLIGVAALLCVVGSLGVGAAAVRRYLLPDWRGAHARLAEIATGCALLVGIMEVLGTVGLFRLVPMVVGSIAVGSALRLGLAPRSSGRIAGPRPARPGVAATVLILISVAGLVVVLLLWTGRSLHSLDHGITGPDSIAYHLPHAASYAQTGQIRAIRYTDYAYLTGLYPATSELFHALGIVLMDNDGLSPGINLIWLALTLLAAWCIGSVRGFGPASMLAAALVMATPMMVGSNAGTAGNDLPGVFFLIAALALWMRTADMPTTDTRAYRGGSTIAAVVAGLAVSVRLNLLGPVAALTLTAIAFTPSGRRRSATGWWIGGLVLGGGYWFARNLIVLGNPLPWFSFGVLPTPHPPPLQHVNNYSLADYAPHPRILRHWLIPALNLNLGPWWPALVAVAMVGPVVCLFSKHDRVILAAALIALASLVAYPLTPLTACGPWGHPHCLHSNIRYGAPALTLALTVTPLAVLFRSQLGRLAAAAVLMTLFVATVTLRRVWTPDYNLGGAHAAVVPIVVVAAIVVLRPWSPIALRRPLVRATAATLALSLMLAGVAVGYLGTRDYLRHRYTDKYGPAAVYEVWRWARGLHHAQIALAGTFGFFFGYPLWGLDDSNRVEYMGQRGPHGSFRPIASCRAWRTALNRGHYQYVVTTARAVFFTTQLVHSPEVDWTRTDPAARLVLSPSRAIQVFRLTGPLHPDRCGSSSGSTSSKMPATSSTAANPVQRENSRPGTPGWKIPAGAGTVITGYASETSVTPGQSFHLRVAAPPGSRYRVLVYRLGWYGGIGGRLVMCVPSCRSSHAAIVQPPPTTPASVTGLFRAPWMVTDSVEIPRDAVSGYYEAKLEIVGGAHADAVGSVPLIVRQSPAAPASAVLVQAPVNTWEAYNPWGGKSLYQFGTSRHALEVSFDRPFDQQEFHDMGTQLELPWVRFLERNGIDVSYQTDVDTDRAPGSLLHHRLVFAIGHDEYWTQRMRGAFNRALALSTNLMFGSNSDEWRMRYAAARRTIVEWRDPSIDPIHNRRLDDGFFRTFGEPECKLMGVEHQWAAQRNLTAPPSSYKVVGPANDPWLAAAGLAPGDVIPGVVGYEWDSLTPGCFAGQVVPLMTALNRGSDGVRHSADMVRATAPSGGRVFAMGTMELAWALDDLDGRSPNPRVVAFVNAALRDLTRPAPRPL